MIRVASLLLLAAALGGCHSQARIFVDGGGYQQMRKEERAEEAERERKEWTRRCRELFKERRRRLDEEVAAIEASAPQGEKELKALVAEWRKTARELILGIPHQANDAPQRADKIAYEAYYHERSRHVNGVLVAKGIEGAAPRQARTILYPLYNSDLNTKRPELEALAQRVAEVYDRALLEGFKTYGGYGRLGATQNRVGCVFSAEPWHEPLGDVEPRFTTHFSGQARLVHVLCRLPLAAKRYARPGAVFTVQLLSDAPGGVDVAANHDAGTPEGGGDSPYLRATFELPPNERFEHSRFFYDVRVLLTWNTGAGVKRQVLSQSSFTWQATE